MKIIMISKNFNLEEKKMDRKKAKEIMRLYIEGQLEMYKDILGEDEDFDSSTLSGLTVQDLEKAYKTIKVELL